MRVAPRDSIALSALLLLLTTFVFAGDFLTPLGVAVWILYIIPLGLTMRGRNPAMPLIVAGVATAFMIVTLFTDEPGITPWVAQVNRACGAVVIWVIALLSHRLIVTRNAASAEDWIKSNESRLYAQLQGDLSSEQISERALAVLSDAFDAPVAALYAQIGQTLQLVGTRGLRPGTDAPAAFALGEGVVGQAAMGEAPTVLRDLPEGAFPIRSAFASTSAPPPGGHALACGRRNARRR